RRCSPPATERHEQELPMLQPPATRFSLRGPLDAEQRDFLDTFGYIHFRQFATPGEIDMIRGELRDIEEEWVRTRRRAVRGIPIKYGKRDDGSHFVNRFAFTSLFAPGLKRFLDDERWQWVRLACGEEFRLGQYEKDGVVVNQFINL